MGRKIRFSRFEDIAKSLGVGTTEIGVLFGVTYKTLNSWKNSKDGERSTPEYARLLLEIYESYPRILEAQAKRLIRKK